MTDDLLRLQGEPLELYHKRLAEAELAKMPEGAKPAGIRSVTRAELVSDMLRVGIALQVEAFEWSDERTCTPAMSRKAMRAALVQGQRILDMMAEQDERR